MIAEYLIQGYELQVNSKNEISRLVFSVFPVNTAYNLWLFNYMKAETIILVRMVKLYKTVWTNDKNLH
jgi:hypothetical protein